MMLKLYNFDSPTKHYWETWDNEDGSHTVHWGPLGERGQSKTIKNSLFKRATKTIQTEVDEQIRLGFKPNEDSQFLLIEYDVEGFGTAEDLDKRHRLEARINETLGWTGLGHCDGGSIGSGSMELCTVVIDTEIAKCVIRKDLADTEFADFTRIYVE